MAAFLAYIFAGSTPPGVKRPKLSLAATAGNAKVKFASYKDCRKCHPQIYKEWERSWHRMAWTDPWVQLSWGCYRDQECRACHLPRPLMEDGKKPRLVARSEDEDKVSGSRTTTWDQFGRLEAACSLWNGRLSLSASQQLSYTRTESEGPVGPGGYALLPVAIGEARWGAGCTDLSPAPSLLDGDRQRPAGPTGPSLSVRV